MREQIATIARTGPGSPREPEDTPAGYKRTEVGIIPEDWQTRRIGDLFETRAGGDFNPKFSSDVQSETHKHPIYANSLSQQGLYGFCTEADNRPGSITITARGTLGKAFYRDTPFVAIGRLLVLDSKIDMDARYFCEFINHGVHFAVESTGVPQLTAPQVKGYYLPVPPSSEQRAIAAVLSDVDELIGSLEALIAKKRAIKQAAMQELLTGRKRLPGFGGEWEVIELGKLVRIRNHKISPVGICSDTPCVELEHIGQGDGRLESYGTAKRTSSIKYCFEPGDILFGRLRPYLRKWWHADRSGICSTEIWPLVACRENADSGFLYFLVQTDRFLEAAETSYGTHMPRADWSIVSGVESPIPPLPEQRAIATVLSDMDAEIAAQERRLVKTRAIKQGMMQQLLTGSIRLPIRATSVEGEADP